MWHRSLLLTQREQIVVHLAEEFVHGIRRQPQCNAQQPLPMLIRVALAIVLRSQSCACIQDHVCSAFVGYSLQSVVSTQALEARQVTS